MQLVNKTTYEITYEDFEHFCNCRRVTHDNTAIILEELGKMKTLMKRFMKDESGAAAVEYGMLIALIAAVIVGVATLLGEQVLAAFQKICTALNNKVAC